MSNFRTYLSLFLHLFDVTWFVYLIFLYAAKLPFKMKYFYPPYYFKVKVKVNDISIFLVLNWKY